MKQKVNLPTRESNIFDLIFTDDEEIISEICHEKHHSISDHDTLIVNLRIDSEDKSDEPRVNFGTTKIPEYEIDDLDEDTVKNIRQIFQNYDWKDVTAESLTNLI